MICMSASDYSYCHIIIYHTCINAYHMFYGGFRTSAMATSSHLNCFNENTYGSEIDGNHYNVDF